MTTTYSRHTTSLTSGESVEESELGSITRVTADTFPILNGLSIKRVVINPGAMRTPHWHANANELTYCLSGTSLISVLDSGSQFSSFTVSAGEMFHIDSGSLHHIENIGDEVAEFIIAFRHERPQDFGLGAAFGAMTDAVLGNTYDLPASDFAAIHRDTSDRALAARAGDPVVPTTAYFSDPHKFAVESQSAPISIAVGSARLARVQFWSALKDLAMYSLRIREDGMREPHWHPITAEMGYVHRGSARMTVMDPDGSLDTWHLKEGDVYFVPRAYPHHIEVVGSDDIHFLIFFDQPTPGDIGYRASASAYSRAVLAATFNTHMAALPVFPFTNSDPLIVTRNNPVDEYAMGEKHEVQLSGRSAGPLCS
jgi:oxalate decarboxylase